MKDRMWILKMTMITLVVLTSLSGAVAPASAQTEDERMYCDKSSPVYDEFTCNVLVRGGRQSPQTAPGHPPTCQDLLDMGPYRAMDISMEAFDRWGICFEQANPGTPPSEQSGNHSGSEAGKRAQIERAKNQKMMDCSLWKQRCRPEHEVICFIDGECRSVFLP